MVISYNKNQPTNKQKQQQQQTTTTTKKRLRFDVYGKTSSMAPKTSYMLAKTF